MSYAATGSVEGAPLRRVNTARRPPMSGGLGEVCPACYISSGSDCEICPDGVGPDFPECSGCVNGVRATLASAASASIFAPIAAGVVTALLVTYLTGKLLRGSAAS